MMICLRIRMAALLVFFTLCSSFPVWADPQVQEYNVLLLNSYSRDFTWTDNQTTGLLDKLQESHLHVNMHVEYLDWKKNPNTNHLQLLYQLFNEEYRHSHLDLIVTTDDAALEFALRYRKEIFSDAPIVFTGVFNESAKKIIGTEKNITGIFEAVDMSGNLELMSQLNQNLKRIILITDRSESGNDSKQLFLQVAQQQRPDLLMEDASLLSEEELTARLHGAAADTAALVMTYVSDGTGKVKAPAEYLQHYAQQSAVPVYTVYDFNMVPGMLGGNLTSGRHMGEEAARLAVRILQGEAVDTIPMMRAADTIVTTIDYVQLEKYRLDGTKIPEGAVVLRNPMELYEKYKAAIWTVIIVVVLLLGYIFILSYYVQKRKKAERILQHKNEELGALYEEIYASQDELHYRYNQLAAVQTALERSEERYKLSFDGANDGLWDWDLLTGEVYISSQCRRILHMAVDGVCTFNDFPEALRQGLTEAALLRIVRQHASRAKANFAFEKEFDLLGEQTWLLIRGKALFDEADQPIRIAGSLTDITRRKEYEAKIHYMAYYDTLTGLASRSSLQKKLEAVLSEEGNSPQKGCLFFLDLDNFKMVNDVFGHSFGDQILIAFAKLLRQVKDDAFLARMGGDEFVLLLENVAEQSEASYYARKIAALLEAPIQLSSQVIHLTTSIGIAFYPDNGRTQEDLLKNADMAMYRAKNSGKNNFTFFDYAMQDVVQKEAALESALRAAVENGELVAWYQPIFDINTGRFSRLEALVRWHNPQLGIVTPNEFIPLAEKSGLILPLGMTVLRQACLFLRQIQAWCAEDFSITVNISALQLMQPDFVEQLLAAIDECEVEPCQIGIEITESILLQSLEENIIKLNQLKRSGVRVYLDDFGTGYSSLKYLRELPIDVVKIDKSFVAGILQNREDKELVHIIICLAHLLQMKIVAEGVETVEQAALLSELGCDAVQGYFYSRPLPQAEMKSFLQTYR